MSKGCILVFIPKSKDSKRDFCFELSFGDFYTTPSYLNNNTRKKLNNNNEISYFILCHSQNTHNRFLEDKVAPHKKLAGGVCFVKELPKTATGKLLRRELKRMAMEGSA